VEKQGRSLGEKMIEVQEVSFHSNRQRGEKLNVRFLVSKVTVAGLIGVAQFFRGL
jgi:hypothetical protein